MSILDWFKKKEPEQRSISISDPILAEYFGVGTQNFTGVSVNENTALGISAVWRACSLISSTIASLPMKTYRDTDDGRKQVGSFLDNPGLDQLTPFEWKETVILHLLLHGNAFLAHVRNGAGALMGLVPIHPLAVSIDPPEKSPSPVYRVHLSDGQRTYTPQTMTHIKGPSLDGIRGMSVLTIARNSMGTSIAGDRSAAKTFGNGALISGLVTPEETVEKDEAEAIKAGLDKKVAGWENAGDIAFVNRNLKFTPWSVSAVDAQFLESRAFQVEEIARWFGVPPHLLMQTDKQTSWGTGISEQNVGLSRYTLNGWTSRIEHRCTRLLPNPRFVEFEYAGLEKPTPEQEIKLLVEQIQGGLITTNEARAIRNLPPIDGGDEVLFRPLPGGGLVPLSQAKKIDVGGGG